jgi:hypothetical protein
MSFVIKQRGSRGGFTLAEYLCPEHGRFEALVERDENNDPPGTAKCPRVVQLVAVAENEYSEVACSHISTWTISAPQVHTQFVITASRGKSDPKPHKDAMYTRMLAEGRKNEFRKQRKKIKEERRHARVKALLE